MARSYFGATSSDWLLRPYKMGSSTLVALREGTTNLTFWSAKTGGTQYTDLLDENGNAATQIAVSGHLVPRLQGPSGIVGMWADKGDGSEREFMEAQDLAAAATAAAAVIGMDLRVKELGYNIKHPDYAGATHKDMFLNTMNAATAAGPGRPVVVPAGVWDVGTGLSLSGQTCTLKGEGGSMTGSLGAAVGSGVTIKASTQSGPVLNFLGYVWPNDHRGRLTFGGFTVQGSGSADATKANIGIRIGDNNDANSAGGAAFRDIVISKTGGPGLKLQRVYLCDFDNIIIDTPVSAKANDVPYFHGLNINANRFSRIGIRSILTAADCGASGAVIVADDGTYPSYDSIFDSWWYEFLHIPTGGCLFKLKANACILRDFSFSDIYPEASATDTAMIRIENGAVDNFGGNMVRGLIPGNDPTVPTDYPTYGIVVSQPRNSIIGVKGYRGANVRLLSGSDNTYAVLGGAQSTASDPAFINDSGVNNHHLEDNYLGTMGTLPTSYSAGPNASNGAADSVAIGHNAATVSTASTSVGKGASSGNAGVSVGTNAASATLGTAIGYAAVSGASSNGTALGAQSKATLDATAVGQGADASGFTGSVALGKGQVTTAAAQVKIGAVHLEIDELGSAPAAPAANGARLFTKDNGSGKTQLCVIFATGAVVVIATQP